MWDIDGREVFNVEQTDSGVFVGQVEIVLTLNDGTETTVLSDPQAFTVLYPTTPAYVYRDEIKGLKKKKRSLESWIKSLNQEHTRLVKLNERQRKINKRLVNQHD